MRLTRNQEEVLKGLDRHFKHVQSGPQAGSVDSMTNTVAIVGARGVGKSTVLRELSIRLESEGFVLTRIVDASIVREDAGLVAEAIESLHATLDGRSATGGRAADDLNRALEAKHADCLRLALLEAESHRALAQDLAMSPGHYAKIVESGLAERHTIPSKMAAYLRDLQASLKAVRETRETKKLVVRVDDLDLARPRLVRSWVRALLADYAGADVHWVFAFDRDRLIERLSDRSGEGATLDLAIGQALLTKLVPFHRQFSLNPVVAEEQRTFRPRELPDDAKPLYDVFVAKGVPDFLLLLPFQLRALESVYRWLNEQEEGKLEPAPLLRTLVAASGDHVLARSLELWPAEALARSFSWDASTLASSTWGDAAQAARLGLAIFEVPLPNMFAELASRPEQHGAVEVILDIGLRGKGVSPYQLLQRMPFARAELARMRIQREIPPSHVVAYFRETTPARRTALLWHEWSRADGESPWSVTLSPGLVWQALGGMRDVEPTDLLQDFFLEPLKPWKRPDEQGPQVLPRRFRALVLLIAGLVRVPWREIDAAWNFWGALTLTQVVAGATLSAYAWGIWKDQALGESPLHLSYVQSAEAVLKLDDQGVGEHYASFLSTLRRQLDSPDADLDSLHPRSAADVARRELRQALRVLIDEPAIKDIGQAHA